MSAAPDVAEAFRRLQAGDARGALEAARRAMAANPSNARAHLAAGVALRALGQAAESASEIETAQRLDPADYGAAYERGVASMMADDLPTACESFQRACELRPAFVPARVALGQALWRLGRHAQAREQFDQATSDAPDDPVPHLAHGRFCVARAQWDAAAASFSRARQLAPERAEWAMYLAQVELLRGRWPAAWQHYALREPRLRFQRTLAAHGREYHVPALARLHGRELHVVREQGLGDELFFLRFAPRLRDAGARVVYHSESKLAPLVGRSGACDEVRVVAGLPEGDVVLSGDLPAIAMGESPIAASLEIAAHPQAHADVRARLARAGPAPWIAVTWRSGTPHESRAYALSKQIPAQPLFAALARLPGTLVALQRGVREGELAQVECAAGRRVHDFGAVAEDLELALAAVSLVDRHVGVSSTNMHLAAAAGAKADVLVPFPPEWRWGTSGASPWFPGFRVHRQDRDGDWSAALARL